MTSPECLCWLLSLVRQSLRVVCPIREFLRLSIVCVCGGGGERMGASTVATKIIIGMIYEEFNTFYQKKKNVAVLSLYRCSMSALWICMSYLGVME